MIAKKTALVLGVTGLVGSHVLQQLARDPRYGKVTCLVRQPVDLILPEQPGCEVQTVVADFDQLEAKAEAFKVDHVYVCLGTTLRQAGSRAAFRKVDYDYVLGAAKLSAQQGVGSFVWISSVGADANSPSFYLRVKGQLEQAIDAIPGLSKATPVHPSLLLGDRQQFRPAEALGGIALKIASPLMWGPLRKYRPVQAAEVARQMIEQQAFE